jgi:hypothetical protein
MKTTKKELQQQLPIFWKGNLCTYIFWETLKFGALKISIGNKKQNVSISELTN